MDRATSIAWLLERGGPTVRYCTAVDLLSDTPPDERERLQADMLSSPAVQRGLECLVLRLMTVARIAAARAHPWFAAALAHLESFRTARGTYRFPAG